MRSTGWVLGKVFRQLHILECNSKVKFNLVSRSVVNPGIGRDEALSGQSWNTH